MGDKMSHIYWDGVTPEQIPPENVKPTFDPHLGFKGPRKEREFTLTEQEMKAAKVPPEYRDYCAKYYIEEMMCIKKYTPFYGLCYPEINNYNHCKENDYILRMKEYEREKRLRIRELKKQGKNIE